MQRVVGVLHLVNHYDQLKVMTESEREREWVCEREGEKRGGGGGGGVWSGEEVE